MWLNNDGDYITSEERMKEYIYDTCGKEIGDYFYGDFFENERLAKEKAEINEWEMIADDYKSGMQELVGEMTAIKEKLFKKTKKVTEADMDRVLSITINNYL